MTHRCRTLLGPAALTLISCTNAWAQEAAKPAPAAAEGATGLVVLLIVFAPAIFCVAIVLIMMKKQSRMLPQVDRSIQIAEDSLRLAKEQVALQSETNRLLAELIEAKSRG